MYNRSLFLTGSFFLLVLLVGPLTSCSPRVDNRGYRDTQSRLEQITPDSSHKQDVLRLLGSPSTRSSFGMENWYYMAARRESVAFFKPEVVQQEVTRIAFNDSGLVTEVERYSLEDGRKVALVEDITPTEGQELGLWEQLLGNFGRFNKAPGKKAPPKRRP